MPNVSIPVTSAAFLLVASLMTGAVSAQPPKPGGSPPVPEQIKQFKQCAKDPKNRCKAADHTRIVAGAFVTLKDERENVVAGCFSEAMILGRMEIVQCGHKYAWENCDAVDPYTGAELGAGYRVALFGSGGACDFNCHPVKYYEECLIANFKASATDKICGGGPPGGPPGPPGRDGSNNSEQGGNNNTGPPPPPNGNPGQSFGGNTRKLRGGAQTAAAAVEAEADAVEHVDV